MNEFRRGCPSGIVGLALPVGIPIPGNAIGKGKIEIAIRNSVAPGKRISPNDQSVVATAIH
jgi:hypothetical protein